MKNKQPIEPINNRRQLLTYRRDVANHIYSIWTARDGMSGLAFPFFSGQIDALGMFVTGSFLNDTDETAVLPPSRKVARVDSENITYSEFWQNYMLENEPVVISGLATKWKATFKWIMPDPFISSDEEEKNVKMVPNFDYLKHTFGNDVVSVHMQPVSGGFQGSSNRPRQKEEMSLKQFSDWWFDYHLLLSTKNNNRNGLETSNTSENGDMLYYMKDWQFVAEHPKYVAYTTPVFFKDDWLNGPTGMGNAYKFCYLGPKGTVTPLHVDVLNSYSWSTNICGKKVWNLIPVDCTHLLYDVFGRQLAVHINADREDYGDGDLGTCLYPGLAEARRSSICVIQQEGETLFVPSGWHHTVENVEPTLSINHNWINGTNIGQSWERILNELMREYVKEQSFAENESSASSQNDKAVLPQSKKASKDRFQGNDLLLFWIIVSKKVNEILNQKSKSESKGDDGSFDVSYSSHVSRYNLENVLPILESMHHFLSWSGQARSKVDHLNLDDIDSLSTKIKAYLDEEEIKCNISC